MLPHLFNILARHDFHTYTQTYIHVLIISIYIHYSLIASFIWGNISRLNQNNIHKRAKKGVEKLELAHIKNIMNN